MKRHHKTRRPGGACKISSRDVRSVAPENKRACGWRGDESMFQFLKEPHDECDKSAVVFRCGDLGSHFPATYSPDAWEPRPGGQLDRPHQERNQVAFQHRDIHVLVRPPGFGEPSVKSGEIVICEEQRTYCAQVRRQELWRGVAVSCAVAGFGFHRLYSSCGFHWFPEDAPRRPLRPPKDA